MKIFLAGGIQKSIKWQDMIIKDFQDVENIELRTGYKNGLYLLNPRREDWIEKPGAAERQIEWEFDMLENCDVFTMYFAGGESDQPICLYELGRNILRLQYEYPESWKDRIVITCNSNYKRLNDVLIQTCLATDGLVNVNVVDGDEESVTAHIKAIKEKLKYIYKY
jgi:hypothetical protein